VARARRREEVDSINAPKWAEARRVSRLLHRRGPRSPYTTVVLIADDVKDTRDLYVEFFQSRGFRAAVARDGEEAVALAASLRDVPLVRGQGDPDQALTARRALNRTCVD